MTLQQKCLLVLTVTCIVQGDLIAEICFGRRRSCWQLQIYWHIRIGSHTNDDSHISVGDVEWCQSVCVFLQHNSSVHLYCSIWARQKDLEKPRMQVSITIQMKLKDIYLSIVVWALCKSEFHYLQDCIYNNGKAEKTHTKEKYSYVKMIWLKNVEKVRLTLIFLTLLRIYLIHNMHHFIRHDGFS